MKISETIERDCCELTKDLVPSADFRETVWGIRKYLFCQHCGQAWEYLENGFGGRSYQRVAVPVKLQFVGGDLWRLNCICLLVSCGTTLMIVSRIFIRR